MFTNRNAVKKRGSVFIQTLFIGVLCLSLSLYCLCYSVKENKKVISYKKYILKKQALHDYKEYLFTCLSNKIIGGVEGVNSSNVKAFLTDNNVLIKTQDNKAYLYYEKIKDCFVLISYSDEFFHREDYYDYTVLNNKVLYKFKNTSYNGGAVK